MGLNHKTTAHCIVVCCSVLQWIVLQCVAVCCSVLQCVAARDSLFWTGKWQCSRCSSRNIKTLQHTATHCNTLQHTATHYMIWKPKQVLVVRREMATHYNTLQHNATHGNTWQHTPTHSNTIIHVWVQTGRCDDTSWQEASEFLKISAPVVRSEIATHYNVLQHTVTDGTTLHHTPTHSQHTDSYMISEIIYDFRKKQVLSLLCAEIATQYNTSQHTIAHCNTLQRMATLCYTLQHTATHSLIHDFFPQKKKELSSCVAKYPQKVALTIQRANALLHPLSLACAYIHVPRTWYIYKQVLLCHLLVVVSRANSLCIPHIWYVCVCVCVCVCVSATEVRFFACKLAVHPL